MDNNKYKSESNNKKNILKIIYKHKSIPRNDLVDKLNLSPATITKFVSELISEGIVEEYGELQSTGGRKAIPLRIVPDYAYVLGIDIGSYMTRIAVIKINGEIAYKEQFITQELNIEELCKKISIFFQKYKRDQFIGIGIGVSGIVNNNDGKIIFCPNIQGWDGLKIKEILEDQFDVHTSIDTSSRCMALAEQWFGLGKDIQNQIFVSIGYGIGAGIIIDSKLFRGNSGYAGELGHIQIKDDQLRCTCGNYGCLENFVTLPLIIDGIKKRLASYNGYSPLKQLIGDINLVNLDNIREALKSGDKVVYEELNIAGNYIGIALANMSNILNPRLIILGGGVIETFPEIVVTVNRTVIERSLIPIHQELNIVRSSLSWDSSIIGSSVLIIDEYFS